MMKLVNYLIAPPHLSNQAASSSNAMVQPNVQFSCKITDSRLDDGLSVAMVEFTNTPQWLHLLNLDPEGFPKKTALGTIWPGVDRTIRDAEGRTEFVRAPIANNLLYAEALAELPDTESQSTDVNMQDNHGRTALHWACAKSLPEIVMLCLSVPGCDVSLTDNDNLTAFDIALQENDDLIPNLFYKSILSLEADDPHGALLRVLTMSSESNEDKPIFPGAAIFEPIEDRNLPLLKALIGRGVDLTAKDSNGDTALHLAAAEIGNSDIVRMLLEAGANVNGTGTEGAIPLHQAADSDIRQLLQEWKGDHGGKVAQEVRRIDRRGSRLERGGVDRDTGTGGGATMGVDDMAAEPALADNHPGMDLIHLAYAIKNIRGYMELKDEDGRTVLLQRAEHGDLPAVIALIKGGASLNAQYCGGETALQLAAKNGKTEIVTALLVGGAKPDTVGHRGTTALLLAALEGHTDTVTALIAGGAQTVAINERRSTALHLAADKGHAETVTALIMGGVAIEATDREDSTALHLAAQNGHAETVTILLVNRAELGAMSKDGMTALHLAAQNGHTEIVTLLLVNGADARVMSNDGRTALHMAAIDGRVKTAEILLDHGARIEARSKDGTAFQMASKQGYHEFAEMLAARGAQTTVCYTP